VMLSPVILGFLGLLVITTLLWSSLSTSGHKASRVESTKSAPKASSIIQETIPVKNIAKQVTVRVLTKLGTGSGVVIAHQGKLYTVLTCEHVIANVSGTFTVLTGDGKTHTAHLKLTPSLTGVDLALIEFKSKTPYQVAVLGNSGALLQGNKVYASGFPSYRFLNQNALSDTRNWGMKAFKLTVGEISLLPQRTLPEGYRLGYTNEVEQGMSGGPVLNQRGQVIGINGRLKYPLQGIDGFTFADGTKPSEDLFKQMEALSWAIPIATFQQRAKSSLNQSYTAP
jgi:serine protease Do